MDVTDPDLHALERVRKGEEQGLIDLMARHREPLFRFVYRFVHNEADAAELTEETFFRVYRKVNTYRPRAKVSTWMYAIASNLCRDFLRREKKRRGDLSLQRPVDADRKRDLGDRLASDAPDPEAAAVSHETLAAVEEAIHALPHRLKIPFVFCVLEGHAYDVCAEMLGVNRKTVETRIYRARLRLRKALAPIRK